MSRRVVRPIKEAAAIVFGRSRYLFSAFATFAVFLVLYAFVLPATYTGGRIGLVSLRLITPELTFFAFLFSLLIALLLPFAVYALRKKQTGQKTSSAAGSFFGSILPPLLCCSPILPSIAAAAAGVVPFAFGVSGFVQGTIATYETEIFSAMVLILGYSVYQNAKQVVSAEQGVCA